MQRLNVEQTVFGETIEFKMRTFRFTSGGTQSSDPQQQTIECDLHLEPSATIVQEQAADCTCYNQEQCQGRAICKPYIISNLKNVPGWIWRFPKVGRLHNNRRRTSMIGTSYIRNIYLEPKIYTFMSTSVHLKIRHKYPE